MHNKEFETRRNLEKYCSVKCYGRLNGVLRYFLAERIFLFECLAPIVALPSSLLCGDSLSYSMYLIFISNFLLFWEIPDSSQQWANGWPRASDGHARVQITLTCPRRSSHCSWVEQGSFGGSPQVTGLCRLCCGRAHQFQGMTATVYPIKSAWGSRASQTCGKSWRDIAKATLQSGLTSALTGNLGLCSVWWCFSFLKHSSLLNVQIKPYLSWKWNSSIYLK